MTFLKTLEDYGLDVSIRQAGIDFANSQCPLWCANKAGVAATNPVTILSLGFRLPLQPTHQQLTIAP